MRNFHRLPGRKVEPVNMVSHGCVEIPDAGIECYIFESTSQSSKPVGLYQTNDVNGNRLEDYPLDKLQQNYSVEGVDYEIISQLTVDALKNVTNFFAKSSIVNRRYKK